MNNQIHQSLMKIHQLITNSNELNKLSDNKSFGRQKQELIKQYYNTRKKLIYSFI
jgi:hypothetical protein